MFYHELQFWEATELRSSKVSQPIPPEEFIEEYLDEFPEGTTIRNLFLSVPHDHVPYYSLFGQHIPPGANESDAQQIEVSFSPDGGIIEDRGHGLAHWLRDIHRDLMLPNRTIGRALVGFAGLLMMVLIISGILIHRKIIKDLFSLRVGRSKRLQWKDTHNAIGIWGLPFHAMIAFSGAYLGLVVILLPVFALVAFKGDQDAAVQSVLGKPTEPTGIYAEPFPISKALEIAKFHTGYEADGVRLENYLDENVRYEIFVHPMDQLQISKALVVDGRTGEVSEHQPSLTTSESVLNAMTGLHYATYGGIWLKVLYIGLGIAMSVLIATGLMVWVERRANSSVGSLPVSTYQRIGRFNAGFCMGLPIATALIFYVDRLTGASADERISVIGTAFVGAWVLTTIIGFLVREPRHTVRIGLCASGILAMGVLPLDALTVEISLLHSSQLLALGIDLGLFVLGGMALTVGLMLERLYQPVTESASQPSLIAEATAA